MTDITSIIQKFRKYGGDLHMTTEAGLAEDRRYWAKITSVTAATKFNYHSDYWGWAECYQEDHIELMTELKPYIRKNVVIDGKEVKLLGIMIDRQYNSLSYTKLLIAD